MKAPDKIYIAETPNKLIEIWSDEPIEPKPYITEHEYIRKDALLEWAEKKKNDVKKFGQRYNEANYYNSGCHDTIQELIDQINSL